MADEEQKDATLREDAVAIKDGAAKIRDGVNETGKAVNDFFTHGNSKVIGPAATKALVQGKQLVNRVVQKLFKRDESE